MKIKVLFILNLSMIKVATAEEGGEGGLAEGADEEESGL